VLVVEHLALVGEFLLQGVILSLLRGTELVKYRAKRARTFGSRFSIRSRRRMRMRALGLKLAPVLGLLVFAFLALLRMELVVLLDAILCLGVVIADADSRLARSLRRRRRVLARLLHLPLPAQVLRVAQLLMLAFVAVGELLPFAAMAALYFCDSGGIRHIHRSLASGMAAPRSGCGRGGWS
jgi:hypothetical protein